MIPRTTIERLGAAGILDLWEKIRAGERLSFEDGLRLFQSPDVVAVGWLANVLRERLHGERTFFNRNLHINATNVCEASCVFCSFARLKTGDPGSWTMSSDAALERIRLLKDELVTEVHIVNGLNPDLPFDYYLELLRRIKAERPELHIKGFTAVEIHYYAEKYGLSYESVLSQMREAGLDSMPGGGAEIFADRARKKLCHDKVDAAGWLSIHALAHRMGMRTNATMLFGSIETPEERVDHLLRLRALQDRSLEGPSADPGHGGGHFQTFIPLRFHNDNNRLARLASPTGYDSLRTIAASRLLLDNFPHIKAYWPMLGTDEAQVALHFGASDLDGTVREEHIYHMAGAATPQGLSRAELIRFIRHADRIPAERDTVYHVLRRCDPAEDPPVIGSARAGIVGYRNAWPLVEHLEIEQRGGHPSEVARWLANGEVDLALLPVGALLSDPAAAELRVVPDLCIGCEGPVASVLIVAETPPEQWTRVLLDGASRTSVLLARLLLQHGPLRRDLDLVEVPPTTGVEQARGSTATVVIGDAALALPERLRHRLDLGEEWQRWTGLPFVFAVWAGRPDLDPSVVEHVRAAGLRAIEGIRDRSLLEGLPAAEQIYLSERIRYPLDDRATMGLLRFACLARKANLVERDSFSLYDPPASRPRAPLSAIEPLLERGRRGDALEVEELRLLLEEAPLMDLLAAAGLRREDLFPGGQRTYGTDEAEPVRILPGAMLPAELGPEVELCHGAGESAGSVAELLLQLRSRADEIRCLSVAPVAESGTVVGTSNNTAVQGLRLLALARLVLPAPVHIQASWARHGRGLAQVALHGGADDFGQVLPPSVGAEPVDGVWPMTVAEAERNLRLAGLEPARRDRGFQRVEGALTRAEPGDRPLRRLDPPPPGR